MKLIVAATLLLATGLMVGCSLTVPVRGQLESGKETFTGTTTGYMDRSGDLEIVSDKGTVCSGVFVYVTAREGEGTFTCNDGRSGPFSFVSTGLSGTGTGRLGSDKFTFVFGNK